MPGNIPSVPRVIDLDGGPPTRNSNTTPPTAMRLGYLIGAPAGILIELANLRLEFGILFRSRAKPLFIHSLRHCTQIFDYS